MRKHIIRDEYDNFAPKSYENRKVRSVRATDKTWDYFKKKAQELDISPADYLELIAMGEAESHGLKHLKQKSEDIIFSDDIRPRDRAVVKRAFALLLGIDKSDFPRKKEDYENKRVIHADNQSD